MHLRLQISQRNRTSVNLKAKNLFFLLISTTLLFCLDSISQTPKKTDADRELLINKDHSEVFFEIDYLLISKVKGRFTQFEGHLDYNPKDKVLKNIFVELKANSVYTGNKMRDSHLKKSDFLFASKFPHITFKSTNTKWVKDNIFLVTGFLKLRGKLQKLSLTTTILGPIKDPWKKESFFARYSFNLKRKDFSLLWNKSLDKNNILLGETVKINGVFQLQARGKKTESSTHMIPDSKILRLRQKANKNQKLTEEEAQILKDYNDAFKEKKGPLKNKSVQEEADIALQKDQSPQPSNAKTKFTKKKISWKRGASLLTLGILALIGAIFCAISLKKFFMLKVLGNKYDDSKLLSVISDLMATMIIVLYALSVYHLMKPI